MTRDDYETGKDLVSPYIEICDERLRRGVDINVQTFYDNFVHANLQQNDWIKDAGKVYSVYHVISQSPPKVSIDAGHIARVHRGFVYEKYLKKNLPRSFGLLEKLAKEQQ